MKYTRLENLPRKRRLKQLTDAVVSIVGRRVKANQSSSAGKIADYKYLQNSGKSVSASTVGTSLH